MNAPLDVELELSRLRSFQQDTARYVFERLFGLGEDGASRFLVADEVGLGKTMVARGVIAQAIAHLQEAGDKGVDVVYICSNGAIAAQNLRKLAPTGVPVEHRTERLPLLAFRLSGRQHRPVNLIALTPGTSFAMGWATGLMGERAAVLRALQQYWGGRRLLGRGIGRIFAGGIGPGRFSSVEDRIRDAATHVGDLSEEALRQFAREVEAVNERRLTSGKDDLDTALHRLAPAYAGAREPTTDSNAERNEIVSSLREALAMTGAHLLQPDLVILDEFQRFRDVIHNRPESGYAGEIAQHLFSYHHEEFNRHTRVLMLSATPYAMHTTSAEIAAGSDSHYADFLETFRFLSHGLPGSDADAQTDALHRDLSAMRSALVDVKSAGVEPVRAAARAISDRLRLVMVRTERLASTPARDGMLRTFPEDLRVPSAPALHQYLAAARVAEHLGRVTRLGDTDVVEYWKGAPYTLSYLGAHGYQIADRLRTRVGPDAGTADQPLDEPLLRMLTDSAATLPWERMRHFGPLDPSHASLDLLWKDFFDDAGAHHLLWMPASLPYYTAGGAFESHSARRLTKRLIFSAWTLVPTAIATLTTYEAERRLHDEAGTAGATVHDYDDDRRLNPRLRFAAGTQSMAHLALVVPSPALARLGDPLAEAAHLQAVGALPTWEALVDRVATSVEEALAPRLECLPTGRGSGSSSWYALAPALLDADDVACRAFTGDADDDRSLLGEHVTEVRRLRDLASSVVGPLVPGDEPGLPPVPADLARVLALASLAGPPAVMFRALARVFPGASDAELVEAAAVAAGGFRSLFNSPEANRIIDSLDIGESEFWRRVLQYCGQGNLQAVMDEYCAVLVESRGYDRAEDRSQALGDAAADVASALTLRTPLYRPAVVTIEGDGNDQRWRQLRLRGRFAMRYGSATTEEKAEQRADEISRAFNSPFWPFILATTSVGQEGLDFHQYCHAVSHWNLPGNPVDLEQREGRVHRYKGHAVRKNVARVADFPTADAPPWDQLFAAVATDDGPDMVPYWVFAPADLGDDAAFIERHLPLTPYTREKSILGPLLESVALYRLAFGQPRQEELLRIILDELDEDDREALAQIRVDLSPPHRTFTQALRCP